MTQNPRSISRATATAASASGALGASNRKGVWPHRFKLLAFDMDGTLIDSLAAIVDASVEAFADSPYPTPSAEQVRQVVGLPLEMCVEHWAPQASHQQVLALAEAYRRAFRGQRERGEISEQPYEGVASTLAALKADETFMAVVTGKDRLGLDSVLAHHDFGHFFHSLQTPDNNPSKPAPDMVWTANRETATDPRDTVVIGDTSFDMEMARNAGAFAVGVTYGNHEPNVLRRSGAHVLIHSFAELPRALAELSEAGAP